MKKLGYGLVVFIIGFILIISISAFHDNGSTGPVTSGTINNGLMALILTILFLCATITVCTLMVVEELKKVGNR